MVNQEFKGSVLASISLARVVSWFAFVAAIFTATLMKIERYMLLLLNLLCLEK